MWIPACTNVCTGMHTTVQALKSCLRLSRNPAKITPHHPLNPTMPTASYNITMRRGTLEITPQQEALCSCHRTRWGPTPHTAPTTSPYHITPSHISSYSSSRIGRVTQVQHSSCLPIKESPNISTKGFYKTPWDLYLPRQLSLSLLTRRTVHLCDCPKQADLHKSQQAHAAAALVFLRNPSLHLSCGGGLTRRAEQSQRCINTSGYKI